MATVAKCIVGVVRTSSGVAKDLAWRRGIEKTSVRRMCLAAMMLGLAHERAPVARGEHAPQAFVEVEPQRKRNEAMSALTRAGVC
jgi:hypothetical protein